jgi:hypothetical protein
MKKPHRASPQTYGTGADAARPGRAGIRRRPAWSLQLYISGRVRVLFFPSENARQNRYPRSPGESIEGRVGPTENLAA